VALAVMVQIQRLSQDGEVSAAKRTAEADCLRQLQ